MLLYFSVLTLSSQRKIKTVLCVWGNKWSKAWISILTLQFESLVPLVADMTCNISIRNENVTLCISLCIY